MNTKNQQSSNVTRIEFGRRANALRALEKLDVWPAFDADMHTAAAYTLWSNGETLHVLRSDGERWVLAAAFVAESVMDHIGEALYLRRLQREEIKRTECHGSCEDRCTSPLR